jgi:hypothetical protein
MHARLHSLRRCELRCHRRSRSGQGYYAVRADGPRAGAASWSRTRLQPVRCSSTGRRVLPTRLSALKRFAAESTRGLSFARAFVLLRWCGSHLVAACSAPAASTHRIRLTRKCPKSSSTQPRALAPSALTLRARSALALLSSQCFVPHWSPTNAARKGKAKATASQRCPAVYSHVPSGPSCCCCARAAAPP